MNIGQTKKISIGGKLWTLSAFKTRHAMAFIDWAKTVLPDPIEIVAKLLPGLTPENQLTMAQQAYKDATMPAELSDVRITALMQTREGAKKLFELLLEDHHPGLSNQETHELFCITADESKISSVLDAAIGSVPQSPVEKKTY